MLQFSLNTFDLNEHIPRYYTAHLQEIDRTNFGHSFYSLSYTWGNPHAKSTMFNFYNDYADDYDDNSVYSVSCNGKLLYLRQNLYDALQQLPETPGLYVKHHFGNNMLNDLQLAAAKGDVGLIKFVMITLDLILKFMKPLTNTFAG